MKPLLKRYFLFVFELRGDFLSSSQRVPGNHCQHYSDLWTFSTLGCGAGVTPGNAQGQMVLRINFGASCVQSMCCSPLSYVLTPHSTPYPATEASYSHCQAKMCLEHHSVAPVTNSQTIAV